MDELDALPIEGEDEHLSGLQKLMALASATGDLSHAIDAQHLARIGADVVDDYERDEADRSEWKDKVEKAFAAAAQEDIEAAKDTPWQGAANVKYPLLTVSALQFNARAYPAIVKGDEAVSVKVVGKDRGRPVIGPDGQPMAMGPQGPISASAATQLPPEAQAQLQPAWAIPPGAKAKRALRVKDYLNTHIFYRMEGWEADTDALLLQLPIAGCAFRKVWKSDGRCHARLVPALKLVAPMSARDCESSPRLTEIIDDMFTYQVKDRQAQGFWRDVELQADGEDEEKPRILLEQHRRMDLDEDGVSEPYIITVDKETRQVLRIESNFGPQEAMTSRGSVKKLSCYYVKYDFFPHPKGCFYGIGFGHLLNQITEVINSSINQLLDAGTAQIAGGGFVAGGVRLQGKGSSSLRFQPGEYKTVNGVTGTQLREAIFERTFPNPSPVAFQLLDMMLGAARDISSVKDVITGEASNQGQVGTTLALIEQGLQVFTAIYKRVYLGLKNEFTMIFECLSRYPDEAIAQDYADILDDPEADFEADFNLKDMDIRPVSDPTSVTKMQKMGRAQFLLGTLEAMTAVGGDPREVMLRVYEAADVEDIDKLLPPPQPPQPDPKAMAEAEDKMASAGLKNAQTEKTQIEAANLAFDMGAKAGGGLEPEGAENASSNG